MFPFNDISNEHDDDDVPKTFSFFEEFIKQCLSLTVCQVVHNQLSANPLLGHALRSHTQSSSQRQGSSWWIHGHQVWWSNLIIIIIVVVQSPIFYIPSAFICDRYICLAIVNVISHCVSGSICDRPFLIGNWNNFLYSPVVYLVLYSFLCVVASDQ